MRRDRTRGAQVAENFDLYFPAHDLVGGIGQAGRGPRAPRGGGGVHQDVHPAEFGDRAPHQFPDLIVVAGIGGHGERTPARFRGQGGGRGLERFGRAGREHHIRALGGQSARDGQPDTLATAGDDRPFSVQFQVHAEHGSRSRGPGRRSRSGRSEFPGDGSRSPLRGPDG